MSNIFPQIMCMFLSKIAFKNTFVY